MKNSQKGFIVPVLLVIIALLVVGGGVYVYKNKKVEVPAVVDTGTQPVNQNQQQTNTQTSPVNTQQKISPTTGTNAISLQTRIDNSTEAPAYFSLVSKAVVDQNSGIKKVELKLTCSSSKMNIETPASQRDDSVKLCLQENKIEMQKGEDGVYRTQASGNSSDKGSVRAQVTAYDVKGNVLGTDENILSFEPKTYSSQIKMIVNSPKNGMTFYTGDTLLIDFTPVDTSKNFDKVTGVIYLHNKASMMAARGYCEDCTKEIVSEFAQGRYTWKIPSDIKSGEYYLEISTPGAWLDNYTQSQISSLNYAFEYNSTFNILKR